MHEAELGWDYRKACAMQEQHRIVRVHLKGAGYWLGVRVRSSKFLFYDPDHVQLGHREVCSGLIVTKALWLVYCEDGRRVALNWPIERTSFCDFVFNVDSGS